MSTSVDRVVLRIRSDAAAAANVRGFVEPIIDSHGMITRAGGFSSPERERLPDLQFVLAGEPTDLEYQAQAVAVDRGAWRVLLDAVRGELFLQDLAENADVQCSLLTASGEHLETEAIAALAYPVSPSILPFELSWTVDKAPFSAAVHLSLVRPPDRAVAEDISQFFVQWQRLIRAYPPPYNPEYRVGGALPTEAVWSHPRTVELALEVYLADEAVFHPVVNYACWLQRRAAVQELVID